jgi:hypothetical protein
MYKSSAFGSLSEAVIVGCSGSRRSARFRTCDEIRGKHEAGELSSITPGAPTTNPSCRLAGNA